MTNAKMPYGSGRPEDAPRAPVRGFFFSGLGDAGASGGGTLTAMRCRLIAS